MKPLTGVRTPASVLYMNTNTAAKLIARRVSKGNNEAQSAALLDELMSTCGRGTLAFALVYEGFATIATAERIAQAA